MFILTEIRSLDIGLENYSIFSCLFVHTNGYVKVAAAGKLLGYLRQYQLNPNVNIPKFSAAQIMAFEDGNLRERLYLYEQVWPPALKDLLSGTTWRNKISTPFSPQTSHTPIAFRY